ncbi:unnamed protein product [Sphagnum tenellum]
MWVVVNCVLVKQSRGILAGKDQKLTFAAKSAEVQKAAEDMASSHKCTNQLAQQHSPYVLEHAHNLVDCYPWGEDAFTKAQADFDSLGVFLFAVCTTIGWMSLIFKWIIALVTGMCAKTL